MVVSGSSLTVEEASSVMRQIMLGETTPAQLGSFLTALSLKGESIEEIAGMATVMREFASVSYTHLTLPTNREV